MRKVAFSGYYGMGNYGDDLFSIVAILGASKYWPDCTSRLLCPPVSFFDGPVSYPNFIPAVWFQYHNMLGKAVRASVLLSGSCLANHLVFAGGSIFHSGSIDVRDLVFAARKKSVKYSAIGVSVGPFKSALDEKKIKDRLGMFDYISVRDRCSYERLSSFNLDAKIVESADLAGVVPLLIPTPQKKEKFDSKVLNIGFSPCFLADRPGRAMDYCKLFINAVERLSKNFPLKVHVICLNQHYKIGDTGLCRYVCDVMNRQGVLCDTTYYQDAGVLETWRMISRLDACFSVRLHGAITAYLCDVPFYLFEYHEKCSKFLSFIGKPPSERLTGDSIEKDEFFKKGKKIIFNSERCGVSPDKFCKLSEKSFLEAPLCEV